MNFASCSFVKFIVYSLQGPELSSHDEQSDCNRLPAQFVAAVCLRCRLMTRKQEFLYSERQQIMSYQEKSNLFRASSARESGEAEGTCTFSDFSCIRWWISSTNRTFSEPFASAGSSARSRFTGLKRNKVNYSNKQNWTQNGLSLSCLPQT